MNRERLLTILANLLQECEDNKMINHNENGKLMSLLSDTIKDIPILKTASNTE